MARIGPEIPEQNIISLGNNKKDKTINLRMLLSYDDSGKCNNAFKLLSRNDILKIAYNSIKSKPGNMVRGTDRETLDGMPIQWFNDTSKSLISETYKFRPARRVLIPKPNGKKRPLGISSPCPPPKLAWGEGIGRGVGLSGNHPPNIPPKQSFGGGTGIR